MSKEKIFKVKTKRIGSISNNTEIVYEGTIKELTEKFSYTLEIGNSYNKKINRNPKGIKSFIKNVQLSYEEKEGSCFTRTSINLAE